MFILSWWKINNKLFFPSPLDSISILDYHPFTFYSNYNSNTYSFIITVISNIVLVLIMPAFDDILMIRNKMDFFHFSLRGKTPWFEDNQGEVQEESLDYGDLVSGVSFLSVLCHGLSKLTNPSVEHVGRWYGLSVCCFVLSRAVNPKPSVEVAMMEVSLV